MSKVHPAFNVYPAIDVLGGACVRLLYGDYNQSTEYSKHPRSMAERWLEAGARWLHVVDLDGAKSGDSVNADAIGEVVQAAQEAGARVQVGGGIRTLDAVSRWLDRGVERCVIGTAALDTEWMAEAVKRFGAGAVIAGLDGRNGQVAVRGWLEQTDTTMVEVAARLAAVGVQYALVTDVARDGALQGANLELTRNVQETSGLNVIASGGVKDAHDVLGAREQGLYGVIAGRSLYDGTLDLAEVMTELRAVAEC